MKQLIFLSMLSLFLLIALPSIVLAHGGNSGRGSGGGDEERIEIRFGNIDEEIADATATFEIRGTVTAMTDDTLTIAGETITVDPTMVSEFEQKGTPEVDDMVKVEGIIVDGTLLAEELEVR